eukprot:TRINITY_DN22429_c0_g1_i1.p1 TRINITY_DN22429_c0_g1~~TRINITY_DN22429_c0_g1_i1.p1  ORF type:complete len:755 (-),score=92.63 TRINITY_DN22429_c0_g1_i1:89-2353(-)
MPAKFAVDIIIGDWALVDQKKLGERMFSLMVERDARILDLFRGDVESGHEANAGGILVDCVKHAINMVKKKNYSWLEENMVELGGRHLRYGLKIQYFGVFQRAMFTALREQLGERFQENVYNWTYVWTHFVVGPQIRGYYEAGKVSEDSMLKLVLESFEHLKTSDTFGATLFEHLMLIDTRASGFFKSMPEERRKKTFVHFIGRGLAALKGPDGGKFELNRLGLMHRQMGVYPVHFAFFQEALMEALRVTYGEHCTDELAAAWAYIIDQKLVQPQLEAPYSGLEDMFPSVSKDGCITAESWQEVFSKLNLKPVDAQLAFAALDPCATGTIEWGVFRRAMLNVHLETPHVDVRELLERLAETVLATSGSMPLKTMIAVVCKQWPKVDQQKLIQNVIEFQSRDKRFSAAFTDGKLETQTKEFVSLFCQCVGWLSQHNFTQIAHRVHQLGLRHAGYGVSITYLHLFKKCFFSALRAQLGSEFELQRRSWTCVFTHYVISPMMNSLFRSGSMTRETALKMTKESFPALKADMKFVEGVFETLFQYDPQSRVVLANSNLTENKQRFIGFVGKGIDIILDGDREDLKDLVELHVEIGVTFKHFISYEDAFLNTLHGLYVDTFSDELMCAWIYVLHFELIQMFLWEPFLSNIDFVADACNDDWVMDFESWKNMVAHLNLSATQLRESFDKLDSEKTGKVPAFVLRRAIINQGLVSNHEKNILRDFCSGTITLGLSHGARQVCPVSGAQSTAELLARCPFNS